MATPLAWQIATVTAIRPETARVRSFRLRPPAWGGHRPGQHVDVRLTAEDGYQAQRSYSIASAPAAGGGGADGEFELTIDRIPDGEVSPYFHDVVMDGDLVEVRGPIGGYFVWEPAMGGPLLLIGGGSGIVPLMSILRARVGGPEAVASVLLGSWRSAEEIIYADELQRLGASPGVEVLHTLTRAQPPGWTGYARRIDRQMLAEVLARTGGSQPLAYVCGPTLLVEAVAAGLSDLGVEPGRIRTERFGPTG